MKYLSRVALMAISLLVCSIAQATDVVFDVTSTDAGAYTSYCGQTCNVTLQTKHSQPTSGTEQSSRSQLRKKY